MVEARYTRRELGRLFAAATLGGVGASLLAACGSPSAVPKPTIAAPAATPIAATATVAPAATSTGNLPKGGTLTVGVSADATWLGDPHQSTSAVDRHFYYAMFNTLVELGADASILPGLARSWTQPDPNTIVFELEQGVKFHDGTPFNAEVAKWNFDRMLSPEPKLIRRSDLTSVASVEARGDYTLVVHLKQPDASLLSTLTDRAGTMVSPNAASKYSLDEMVRNPVGTGPFRFVQWLEDDNITVERNPDYFRQGFPYVDRIVFKPISDATVRLANLRSGSMQLIEAVSPRDVTSVQNDSTLQMSVSLAEGFDRLELNGAKPPFDNVDLRRVLACGIDRQALHRVVYLNQGAIAQGPIDANNWAYTEIPGWGDKADPQKAKEFLKSAGHPDGFDFEIDVDSQSQIDMQRAELIQQQLKQIGVQMNVYQYKGAVGTDRRSSGTYVARVGGWSGRPDPQSTLLPHYHTGGANNWGKYSNPQVDAILEQAGAESDQARRKALYAQVLPILSETVAEVFHEFQTLRTAYGKRLVGFKEIPDGRFRLERVALQGS